jgi:preprotein translocase subunit SecA
MTPTQQYRRTWYRKPKKLLTGLDAMVHGGIGRFHRRANAFTRIRESAEKVDAMAGKWKDLDNHHLHAALLDFRAQFRRGGKAADEVLLPALAAIREASERQLGLRPFTVQLMGALALNEGFLAEMATGEGKTLTAGIAAVLAGWTKRPVHVITVNDYLVKRDPDWLRQLYKFCGVRVGCVTGEMPPDERRQGYNCDVTYATSKEVLADFLRDRIQLGPVQEPARQLIQQLLRPRDQGRQGVVMRGLHTAIVDEADSVLIDEAVTPLIISAPRENEVLKSVVRIADDIASPLVKDTHYKINLQYREAEVTKSGRELIEESCSELPGFWKSEDRRMELVRQSLVAREFYQRGKQYIVDGGKIVIVDEFTGRPMPNRSWRQGMHQAIEAKEGVEITDPTETIARLSHQRFFRFYSKLSGMTGTAREAAPEFWQIYKLPVISIPTNRPCIRVMHPDRIFGKEEDKWRAIVDEIVAQHATGRPILVGTRSVFASENLAERLRGKGMSFRLLNAVHHGEEAGIITTAGEPGRITIATNMAGRGTDIKLGRGMTDIGGLHVIATERHESGRVDRQLFGRSARQGDPGSAIAFVSGEDELIKRHLKPVLKSVMNLGFGGGELGRKSLSKLAFKAAQDKAQKMAFKQRKSVLRMDTWMEEALGFTGAQDM